MLYLKLLGGGLLVAAGGFSAFSFSQFEKRRLSVLDAWIDLIFFIRGKIDCYLMPLDEILSTADQELLKACMCASPHPNLRTLLDASSAYLTEESKRLLGAFVKEIGSSYREEQLRRCDYYIQALRAEREQVAKELPARRRLSVSLSLCAAFAAAILLW